MAEDKSMGKIIALIIVIIVLIVVLVFIFKPGTLNYFRNLPGYQVDKNDKEVSGLIEGQAGKIVCNGKPGRIVATISNSYIAGTNMYISQSGLKRFLPGGKAESYTVIRYDDGHWYINDPIVAIIGNNQITISAGVDSDLYNSIKSQLDLINGAYFYTTNQICAQDGQLQ